MKEYTVLNGTRNHIASDLNEAAKLGWVPIHFAMGATDEVDTFGILLERENRAPMPKRGDS